jgi:hypothetical protein
MSSMGAFCSSYLTWQIHRSELDCTNKKASGEGGFL